MTESIDEDVALKGAVASQTGATEPRADPETGGVQSDAVASLIAAERDQNPGRLDAIAGSEFVDDRIRLFE